MNRTSLDFLTHLFPEHNYLDFNILIINQTEEHNLLRSNYENIRVINAFEKGLAKSRNLAIKNATGDICLLADDDVKYKKQFSDCIIKSFTTYPEADIITFKMQDFDGNDFKIYSDKKQHDLETIKNVNSVVIGFNRKQIINSNLYFDEAFGLGSDFQTADEYIFLREALQKNLTLIFEPQPILSHPKFSSGQDNGNDKLIFARAALYYKYSGILGYLKLIKHLYLLNKQGYIKSSQLLSKFKIGLKGISHYKRLNKQNTHD
ncbi:glycosyltransferase family A protein [Olleya aquimaris]|nr:glycosyltransferase family 2 protein [Olleya aquimaris]